VYEPPRHGNRGQWAPDGDVPELLRGKLAECLWWVLVLADRLDVDISDAALMNASSSRGMSWPHSW
jgi:NTP pyrophosphatase (non-canonical NTP hydrolase)